MAAIAEYTCKSGKEREIFPVHDEGGEAGREDRIRSRVWQHLCNVDQKRWYNDAMHTGCVDLNDQFNIRMWKAHHDVNLMYGLTRINNAQQRQEIDRYCGHEPDDLPGCNCGWRNSTSSSFVEPAPNHPCNLPKPRVTRTYDTERHLNAFRNDRRGCLQAKTANGFAWPDTLRPLTLATFGRDADADWCLYKNPVKVVPVNMSRKEKNFTR